MTEEKSGYTAPICRGCGKELKFVRAKNKEGIIKAHPVNPEAILLLISTGEQEADGKYIYAYRKGYQSHFGTCTAIAENKPAPQDPAGEEKPPF